MCVCAGGQNKTSGRVRTEKYDAAEDTWTEIPDMNVNACILNAGVFDDTIFVTSGHYNEWVAYFDGEKNQWFVSLFGCSGLYNHNM
jgi:hypothetical protein